MCNHVTHAPFHCDEDSHVPRSPVFPPPCAGGRLHRGCQQRDLRHRLQRLPARLRRLRGGPSLNC